MMIAFFAYAGERDSNFEARPYEITAFTTLALLPILFVLFVFKWKIYKAAIIGSISYLILWILLIGWITWMAHNTPEL